jgi:hypothetical protein
VLAGLIPPAASQSPPEREIVQPRTLFVRIRPRPTPSPPPRVVAVAPAVTPAPARLRSTGREGRAKAARSRPAAPRPLVLRTQPSGSKPVWGDIARSGAGALASQSGVSAGSGEGAGKAGEESGAAGGSEPCGLVEFSDPHGSQYDPRTRGFYVDIRMSVHFADGSAQSLILDYPWYYESEAANPWSDRNLKDPSFPTRFQPPPAAKAANEPELVRYVMDHSTADGMTLLKDCPTAAPPS